MNSIVLTENVLHIHELRSTGAPPEVALMGMVARHC